jgi:hypothetical protein
MGKKMSGALEDSTEKGDCIVVLLRCCIMKSQSYGHAKYGKQIREIMTMMEASYFVCPNAMSVDCTAHRRPKSGMYKLGDTKTEEKRERQAYRDKY